VTSPAPQPTFVATPIPHTAAELEAITYTSDGLVGAIVQDATDGAVLMFAWMNAESLAKTLETGRTWFWSRSRQEYWCKGETSGDRQYVRSVRYDCDGDCLLVTVDQEGAGACHTGSRTCFFRAFGDDPGGAGGPTSS
jgi:phosphoribosyl-AMP cyclohydrolase